MGQARHRKKLLALGPKGKGVGIGYFEPPRAPEPTEKQLAAKAVRQQEEQILDQRRQYRREIVAAICAGAENMLNKWKRQVENNAVRLRNFAGWTTGAVCSLPVDSDTAKVYCEQFSKHRLREAELTLEMMDEIVRRIFHERNNDTAAAEILNIVRAAAEESLNEVDFDKQHFLDALLRRQRQKKSDRDWIYYGLGFVHEMMTKTLRIERGAP